MGRKPALDTGGGIGGWLAGRVEGLAGRWDGFVDGAGCAGRDGVQTGMLISKIYCELGKGSAKK